MITTKVNDKYRITIPPIARDKFHIDIGDIVEVEVRENEIVLIPKKLIDASQAWYWTKEWQQGEKEVDEAIKNGEITKVENVKELRKHLDS